MGMQTRRILRHGPALSQRFPALFCCNRPAKPPKNNPFSFPPKIRTAISKRIIFSSRFLKKWSNFPFVFSYDWNSFSLSRHEFRSFNHPRSDLNRPTSRTKERKKGRKRNGQRETHKGRNYSAERKWQFTFLVARLKPLFVGRRSRCSVHPHKWPDIFRVGTCVAIGNGHELVRCNGTARATTSATTQRVSGACMHHWRNKYVERGR